MSRLAHLVFPATTRRSASRSDPRVTVARLSALIEHVERLRREWAEMTELTSDYRHLANQASIRRWELYRMWQEASALPCLPAVSDRVKTATAALANASEGFHYVSNGYRYNKFRRVCEGAELFDSACQTLARVRARLADG